MRRILLTLPRLGLGIGLLVYLVKSKIVDLHALSSLISTWPISVAAIALILVDLVLMAWRLCWLFRPQRLHLSWGDSLRLASVSSFFANFLPGRTGGDLAKIFYVSKENAGRRAEIVTVLLFDRAVGLFSLLLLPLLLAPFFPALLRSTVVCVALAIMGMGVLGMAAAFLACLLAPAPVRRWAAKSDKPWPGKEMVIRLLGTIAAYGDNPRTLVGALGISLADNVMSIGVLALAILVVNPANLAARLCILAPIGQIVNSLPLTPGGVGVGETAFHALFSLAGLKGGADALLCWRIWNAIVGLLGLVFYLRGFRTRILAASSDRTADRAAAFPLTPGI